MAPMSFEKNIHFTNARYGFASITKMYMNKNVLNVHWKFPRGIGEDQDSFIQKALKL